MSPLLKEKYTIEGILGKGGFSTVFLVCNVENEMYYAFKVVDKNDKAAIERERGFVYLSHEHLLNYIEYIESDESEYVGFVTECFTTYTLSDALDTWNISLEDRYHIIYQILLGLSFMHSQKKIHRDIKPENILIAKRENGYEVKIADFGISKSVSEGYSTIMTQVIGTPLYMAPEQQNGNGNKPTITTKVDIYALGVIVQILFGEFDKAGQIDLDSLNKNVCAYQEFKRPNTEVLREKYRTLLLSCVRKMLKAQDKEEIKENSKKLAWWVKKGLCLDEKIIESLNSMLLSKDPATAKALFQILETENQRVHARIVRNMLLRQSKKLGKEIVHYNLFLRLCMKIIQEHTLSLIRRYVYAYNIRVQKSILRLLVERGDNSISFTTAERSLIYYCLCNQREKAIEEIVYEENPVQRIRVLRAMLLSDYTDIDDKYGCASLIELINEGETKIRDRFKWFFSRCLSYAQNQEFRILDLIKVIRYLPPYVKKYAQESFLTEFTNYCREKDLTLTTQCFSPEFCKYIQSVYNKNILLEAGILEESIGFWTKRKLQRILWEIGTRNNPDKYQEIVKIIQPCVRMYIPMIKKLAYHENQHRRVAVCCVIGDLPVEKSMYFKEELTHLLHDYSNEVAFFAACAWKKTNMSVLSWKDQERVMQLLDKGTDSQFTLEQRRKVLFGLCKEKIPSFEKVLVYLEKVLVKEKKEGSDVVITFLNHLAALIKKKGTQQITLSDIIADDYMIHFLMMHNKKLQKIIAKIARDCYTCLFPLLTSEIERRRKWAAQILKIVAKESNQEHVRNHIDAQLNPKPLEQNKKVPPCSNRCLFSHEWKDEYKKSMQQLLEHPTAQTHKMVCTLLSKKMNKSLADTVINDLFPQFIHYITHYEKDPLSLKETWDLRKNTSFDTRLLKKIALYHVDIVQREKALILLAARIAGFTENWGVWIKLKDKVILPLVSSEKTENKFVKRIKKVLEYRNPDSYKVLADICLDIRQETKKMTKEESLVLVHFFVHFLVYEQSYMDATANYYSSLVKMLPTFFLGTIKELCSNDDLKMFNQCLDIMDFGLQEEAKLQLSICHQVLSFFSGKDSPFNAQVLLILSNLHRRYKKTFSEQSLPALDFSIQWQAPGSKALRRIIPRLSVSRNHMLKAPQSYRRQMQAA